MSFLGHMSWAVLMRPSAWQWPILHGILGCFMPLNPWLEVDLVWIKHVFDLFGWICVISNLAKFLKPNHNVTWKCYSKKKSVKIAIRFPIIFYYRVPDVWALDGREMNFSLLTQITEAAFNTIIFSLFCSYFAVVFFSSSSSHSWPDIFGIFFVGSNQLDILSIIWIMVWLKISRQIMFHVAVWPNLSVGSILKTMYKTLSYRASSAQEWSTMF